MNQEVIFVLWSWSYYCSQPLEGLVNLMSEIQPLFVANAFTLDR